MIPGNAAWADQYNPIFLLLGAAVESPKDQSKYKAS